MYTKNMNHHFPLYSTCAAATLKFSKDRIDSGISTAEMSPQTPPIIIPVQSPGTPTPLVMDDDNPQMKSAFSSSSSHWWSWTFSFISWPFIVWGCPFYLLIIDQSRHFGAIRTTGTWLKRVFDCSSLPCLAILTALLLAGTILIDGYFLYLFSMLVKNLFIDGVYAKEMLVHMMDFFRDIPVVLPLNYVWLKGYRINNMIGLLNLKQGRYSQLSCGGFRVKLIVLFLVIVAVHLIRFFSYAKYHMTDTTPNLKNLTGALASIDYAWSFSVDIFVTLMLPVYCAFCFAIRFELNVIKAIIYEMVSTRVTPTMVHLNKFKMLYTHAADHIDAVNGIFSSYMSIAIIVMIVGTIADAENLIMAVTGLSGSIFGNLFGKLAKDGEDLIKKTEGYFSTATPPTSPSPSPIPSSTSTTTLITTPMTTPSTTTTTSSTTMPTTSASTTTELFSESTTSAMEEWYLSSSTESPTSFNIQNNPGKNETSFFLDPVQVRQMNSDILCILLVYGLIFYTVWQAVSTNDSARELHVWLNDLVTGGVGTDVDTILIELGTAKEVMNGNELLLRRKHIGSVMPANSLEGLDDHHLPPIWGCNKYSINGESDQFMDKVTKKLCYKNHLKKYINNLGYYFLTV